MKNQISNFLRCSQSSQQPDHWSSCEKDNDYPGNSVDPGQSLDCWITLSGKRSTGCALGGNANGGKTSCGLFLLAYA